MPLTAAALLALGLSACSSSPGASEPGTSAATAVGATLQAMPLEMPAIGRTRDGDTIRLGGLSGLWFEGVDPATGELRFLSHTDRGPNGEPFEVAGTPARPFALPEFQPRLVRLACDPATGRARLVETVGLRQPDGRPVTGLANLHAAAPGRAFDDERCVDLRGSPLPDDPMGLDLEGICRTRDGAIWMVDEYRPSICRFSPEGVLQKRYVPEGSNAHGVAVGVEALPAVYAQRRINRGFEGVATDGEQVYAFMQSGLDNPDLPDDENSRKSRLVRILRFDPASERCTGEFAYILEPDGSDKIGDAAWIAPGRFLVIERDDTRGRTARQRIYEIDLAGATDVLGVAPEIAGPGGPLERLTAAQRARQGIVPVRKRLWVDLARAGFADISAKAEGLAFVGPDRVALVNDDDFGMDAGFDPRTGRIAPRAQPPQSVLAILRAPMPVPAPAAAPAASPTL
ncbi:MAG: esterase-like activity of phytase family protein [Phycisphaerales bacterium]